MACKYVKDFSFPADKGFTGSAGQQPVQGYMRGGKVKAEAKIAKTMGEFGKGDLHSGSKHGPVVTGRKQAVAIALNQARKEGADIPVKKGLGGIIKAISPLAGLAGGAMAGGAGAGALGGVAGLLLEKALRKQKQQQPLTMQDKSVLAASQPQATMKHGGRAKGVPSHSREPLIKR